MARPAQAHLDRRFCEGLQWARWAVGRWADFPVDQIPRPLVLVGSRVTVEQGFATGDAKLAFMQGAIESVVTTVPEAVLAVLAHKPIGSGPRAERPLVITGGELADTEFVTDRGRRRLPAWRLTAEDVLGAIWVLDPDIADWRPAPGAGGPPPDLQAPAQGPFTQIDVGPDDRTVTLHWLGARPEYEQYPTAEVVESPHAVALVARGIDVGPNAYRTLAGFMHEVPASLQRPLGSRVLVDLDGNAAQALR